MSKYLVKDFQEGLHSFDTLFIEVGKEIYQVPISKELNGLTLINQSISIETLFRPIEKLEVEEVKNHKK